MPPTLGGDVAVVGAGLIGLGIAFELAERGANVRVFDRAEPAKAASWAGAGMLAPYSERVDDADMLALCAESLAEYPSFVRRVFDASGIDSRLRLTGIVNAAFDAQRLSELHAHARELESREIPHELLDRAQALSCEPALGSHVLGALVVRNEGSVDNRLLGRALTAACLARGVTIVREAGDLAVECDSRRVLGVRSARGFAPAQYVVNATGAWAADLAGVPAAARPPVTPVKGQMMALAMPRGFVRRTTWIPGAYLVPRDDGRLLIGATTEREGFDHRVTAAGAHALLAPLMRAMPALGDLAIVETWAGLRPGTPDGRPFLGPTPIAGLLIAAGHYRNGILLTPATARSIADAIETGRHDRLEPFALARLGTEAGAAGRISHA